MNDTILEIKHLHKIYTSSKNPTHALNDVSLSIKSGEIMSLLGVNGAGKTTLSSIIATLHPPSSGEIFFEGKSIYSDLTNYRRSIGFCPQKPNLDPYLNVRENLIFAARYMEIPKDQISSRVDAMMNKFSLDKYANFEINNLSGGWKQRLLIARAMIHNPRIIILDEPTVGLDPDIRRHLWEIIKELKNQGVTIILTTHYLDEAEVLSDRACILHKGKIILTERIEDLKVQHNKQTFEETFLAILAQYEE